MSQQYVRIIYLTGFLLFVVLFGWICSGEDD